MCKRAKAWICIQYIWVSFLPAGWGEKICWIFFFLHSILVMLRQIFWHTGFQAVMIWDRSWDFHVDVFAYISVELPRKKFVMFLMFSSPSPLADFENNSSPHSQGWSPGPGMGQAWAWCQALSTAVMTRHCRPVLLPCSQSLSLTWIFPSFHQFYTGSNLHVVLQQLGWVLQL